MTNSLLAGVDDRVNFGFTTVTAAPAPATTGKKVTVAAGPRPEAPYFLTVYSSTATRPLAANAEVLRCTHDEGGELTCDRGAQGSTPRGIAVGDIVLIGETRDTLRQLEEAMIAELGRVRETMKLESQGMLLGVSTSYEQTVENVLGTTKYLPIVKERFGGFWTPETEGKMLATFNSGGRAKPTHADVSKAKAMAEAYGPDMLVKLHTVLWHNELPEWLTNPLVAWTPATFRAAFMEYIDAVVPAFIEALPRGEEQLVAIDGLNEVIAEAGVGLRNSIYVTQLGGSTTIVKTNEVVQFYAEVLNRIHSHAPNVPVLINEFGCERESQYRTALEVTEGKPLKKGDSLLLLVTCLNELGAHLDGIGYQFHLPTTFFPTADEAQAIFEKAVALGKKPVVTEMDIKLEGESEGKNTLGKQAEAIGNIVTACERMGCATLGCWGASDARSWLGASTLTTGPRGTMFDTEYNAKPAWAVLAHAKVGAGPSIRTLADRLSTGTARAVNTPFIPSQAEASKTGKDCEVALTVTLGAEETEYEVMVGGRRKVKFKRKAPTAGDTADHTFTVPADTAWEVKTAKGAPTVESTYEYLSR